MQELNREANTLGSKATDITITQVSMNVELFIDQMREQIQKTSSDGGAVAPTIKLVTYAGTWLR
jgi:hypothetical protein